VFMFHGSTRRMSALVTVGSLVALGLVVLPLSPAAAAGSPAITVAKSAPSSVLAGKTISYTLTATNPSTNPGAAPEYNASFRDVLPIGVSYAGPTTPADAGAPTIYTNPSTGQQTLVWSDVADIGVDASTAITFAAAVDPTVLPVASTVTNTANAYASTAPRTVPKFDSTGAPVANASVQSATSTPASTTISALEITKAEPSPESKLLRGIHDHPTVYTLVVSNTAEAATNNTTVTDYLPANQEFLGCGQVDNSAAVEYPGAPRLTATPAVGANCPTPVSVATVLNPPANGSIVYPPGVYTKVVWNVGTLAPGQSVTIQYAAGIPLRENVLFSGGPSAASLGQSANLDNNTGPSTRQTGSAAPSINYAHAAGSYTGPVASGASNSVVADVNHTVTVNDLRIYKSVTPSESVAGQQATYTLHVDSGEYTDNSAITITDTIPNGVCPLSATTNYVTGAPAECAPGSGFAPSLPYQSVTQNADGTFTIVFQPIAVPKDGSTVITYQARDRTVYTGGALAGDPVAAGDSFTNTASEQGTSTAVPATGFTGTDPVQDGTSATQVTTLGTLSKSVAARLTTMNCNDPSAVYGTANPVFYKGDRICFQITVPFSNTNQTRNAVVTDFLPDNTSYEAGSVSYPAANTVAPSQINFDTTGAASGQLTWKVGSPTASGATTVPIGKVFVARFSVIVGDAATGPGPDKTGNIVKLRTTNAAGVATSLRDLVDFQIGAAPPVGVTKGVASVNGSSPDNPPNTDHVQVKEGDVVKFRVDATNNGSAANSNNIPISGLTMWDVLPAGITCAMVSAISDAGTCTNPGAAGQPSFAGNTSQSAIVWSYTTSLAPAATKTFNYSVTIPPGISVSTDLVNTAAVPSYTIANDTPGATTFYPSSNIDTSVPASSYDAPAASDVSDVYLADVTVTKGVVSAINESGNVGAESSPQPSTQATIGEQVTFTVTATVPSHTTVYNATFADPLPAGLTLTSATGTFRPDSGSATTAPLPAGVSFSASAPPSFTFPATYDNTSATAQVFSMTIVATVTNTAGNANGAVQNNTGSFSSQTAASGGSTLPARSASAAVDIVEPAPALTKTNNAGGPVTGGQTITYTLKPSNGAGLPPLHNAWQLDCLPTGMTFAAYGTLPTGVTTSAPVAGNGSNGCNTGFTVLAWNLGDLAGGTTLTLTYTATVDPTAVGDATYVNSATVSGNSLAGNRTSPVDPGNPAGRQYSANATSPVSVAGAAALKTVTPTSATIGQTVTYHASAVLPAGVNFYNLSLIDQLPAGIDAASVVTTGITCANADTSACTPTTGTALAPAAGGNSSTTIGWLFGNVAATSQVRTITVTYTAKVADVAAATAGAGLVNGLKVAWDNTATTPPTSAGATFDDASPTVNATVTVLEPQLGITKSVSNQTPEPGQSFTYTVGVHNANTATTSAAYNVTVTDAVPTGVVVDPATISNGGTISGQGAGGGGTISWTVAGPLAPNATISFTYQATLAASSTLTGAGLLNTAKVTGYDSLPSGGRHYTGPQAQATVTPSFPMVNTVKATPAGSTAYIGQPFPWKITVTNSGAGSAYQVGTVDTLPANWTYDAGSAQVSIGGVTSQLDPTVTTAGSVQTLTWTGLGTLAPTALATITFTATPQAGVTGTPGVGLSVDHTNSATSTAQDATGATGNAHGPYSGGPGTAAAHIASADVAISKAVGIAPVAGGSGTFTLTVHNNGPDTATGPFTVTDPFNAPAPSGISNISASGAGWTCQSTAPLTCQRTTTGDTLASGASFEPITVSYSVAQGVVAGTTLPNTAQVSALTHDPNPGNNTAGATATVTASADLAISKTVSSASFVAGQSVSYSLAVTNLGPSAAAGPVVVNDPLPAGTTFVSASGAGWTCDSIAPGTVGATLHCTLPGPVLVGTPPAAITVTIGLPSSQTADVTNTATVSSPTPDPVPGNNSSTVTTTPTTSADLSIVKHHLTNPFVAGKPVVYQLDVHNAGPSDAAGVQVHDTLPAGLSYQSFSSADANWNCSAAGGTVTCTYTGTLTTGTTSSISLTVLLASNFTGSAVNTATVSATTPDPVPGNNSSTDNSSTNEVADLSIVKTHTGTNATAGSGLTFHLAVHNAGPSDAAGPVTVSDPLPAGLTYGSATGTGWSCSYTSATRLVSCDLAAGLASGADAPVIDVATTVDSDVLPSTITNTATVTSPTTDPNQDNNTSSDPVPVTDTANLSLTKTLATPTPVLVGTDATFDLTASNAGPSDAQNVTVTDLLPANLSFVSFTGDGWSCAPSGQNVVCTRASLAAGATAPVIALTTLVSASTPVSLPDGTAVLQNNATVNSDTPGGRTNPPTVDVPVQAKADLTLVKTPKTGTVRAGDTYTWNLAVHNNGPSDAASPLTVTDTLPGYETFVSANAPWNCTATPAPSPASATSQQVVTCTLAQALPTGGNAAALQLLVQIDASAPVGDQTNTATASTPTPGQQGSDSAVVTVSRTAKLSITKVHTGNAMIGSNLDFTIGVHNAGPSTADQVEVTDPLPTGMTFVSATGTNWQCSADATNLVTCDLAGTLAVGADAPNITLTVAVGAAAYPAVTNTATVKSTDPQLPGTATASDPVTVNPSAALHLTKTHTGTFTVGKTGTYTLTVSNTGLTQTPGPVVITDPLPAGLSYASATGTGWTCSAKGSTVTCTHAGALAVGASSSVALVVNVLAAAYPEVTNTASATAPGSPPATASDPTPVSPEAVLSISKKLVSYQNNVATYLISVSNHGPNPSIVGIVMTDKLPQGLTFRSVTASNPSWKCDSTVSCRRGAAMPVNATDTFTIVAGVNAPAGTTINNVATATGGVSSGSTSKVPTSSAVLSVTASGSSGGGGSLAFTGRDTRDPMVFGIGLLLAGLGLLLLGRRRRHS
jgi:uncharacterized repeat protein (TIGR01451 family)/fimbrial isopeptide formation D2 family protein